MQVGTLFEESNGFGFTDKDLHQRHQIVKRQAVAKVGKGSGTDAFDTTKRLIDRIACNLHACFVKGRKLFAGK